MTTVALIEFVKKQQFSMLTPLQLKQIAGDFPFQQILIRCNGGRFVCGAGQTQHFLDIIAKEGSDHVRDISLFSWVK